MSGAKRIRPIVVLSADPDILNLEVEFRTRGFTIVSDTAISEHPRDALHDGGYFLVISHGDEDGSVHLHRSDWGAASRRWLSIHTKPVPKCSRLLLFSCHGGKNIHRAMKKSAVWGHRGPIPVPTGTATSELIPYYLKGLTLLAQTSDTKTWENELLEYARHRRKITFARSIFSGEMKDHLMYRVWDTILETFRNTPA